MSNVYPHAVRFSALVKSVANAGKSTEQVSPFELGLIDPKTWKTVSDASTLKGFRIVVGSPNDPKDPASPIGFQDPFNRRVSFKSMELKGIVDDSFYTLAPRSPKQFIGYYGFNGLNDCQSIKFDCGETVEFEVKVQGSIVERLYQQFEVFERFSVNAPCCPDSNCTTNCDTAVDCGALVEKIVKTMNDSRQGQNKVARFGKFSVVKECGTNPVIPTFPATKWCLSLCDNGDSYALDAIKTQYPGTGVTRINREGSISTYQFCKDGVVAPANYVPKTSVKLAVCTTCPSGYTLVAATDVYTVVRPLAGTEDLTSDATKLAYATTVAGAYTGTNPVFISQNGATASIQFEVPAGTVVTALLADALIAGQEKEATCTPAAATPIAWVNCGTAYKIKRKLCLDVKNETCDPTNATTLAEMQAFYATNPTIVANSIVQTENGDCLSRFEMEQYNVNCLEDGCDTTGFQDAVYVDPNPFKGVKWGVCPCATPDPVATDCKCGIKVESHPIGCDLKGCGYDPTEFIEYDIPVFEIHRIGVYPGCDNEINENWFVAQTPSVSTLDGHRVLQELLLYRQYRFEPFTSPSQEYAQKFLEVEGIRYGIDPCKKYYVLHLSGNYGEVTSLSSSFGDKIEDLQLFFEDRATLESTIKLLSTYTMKPNIQVAVKFQD